MVKRLLNSSAPFASIWNGKFFGNSKDPQAGPEGAFELSATQSSKPSKVSTAGWGKNRMPIDDASPDDLPDLDDLKQDVGTTLTDEEKEKYREEKFLVHRVDVIGADRELTRAAEEVVQVKENFRCSQSDVADSVRAIQSLGYFEEVSVEPIDSRDGVVLQFKLSPLPPFRGYRVEGHTMLPPDVIAPLFDGQRGKTSNYKLYQEAVRRIDEWYDSHKLLGAVIKDENPFEGVEFQSGEFVFKVSELKLGNIMLKFVNGEGNPAKPVTRKEIVMREVCTQPGQIFDQNKLMKSLDSIASTGLFENVRMVPTERLGDASAGTADSDNLDLDLTIELQEKEKMRHVTGGIGLSTEGRTAVPIGAISFSHINLFGKAQKLSASLQLNQSERSFTFEFADPWLNSGPRHVGQVCGVSSDRKGGDALFARVPGDEAATDDAADAANGAIAVERLRCSLERSMPLSDHIVGSAGVSCMRSRCVGEDGRTALRDPYQWRTSKSADGKDHALKLTSGAAYNNLRAGVQGALTLEHALQMPRAAWRNSWLNFTRVTGKACKEVPLGPVTLRLAGIAGLHAGDCPPYEAHVLGGVNCVRGWAEGGMGTARNWVQTTVESEWPILQSLHGVLFVDGGSDLNSGQSVAGDPAGARGKAGRGLGYGAGVRVASPLGPIRLEYAWTNQANWLAPDYKVIPRGRFHLGIGARF